MQSTFERNDDTFPVKSVPSLMEIRHANVVASCQYDNTPAPSKSFPGLTVNLPNLAR